MTAPSCPEARTEGALNSFIRKHGRKFTLTVLGINVAGALSTLSLAVLMWGPHEAAPHVGAVVLGFTGVLSAALAFYNGSQAAIEWKHAAMGTAEDRRATTLHPATPVVAATSTPMPPPRPTRMSGTAHIPHELIGDLRLDDESRDE